MTTTGDYEDARNAYRDSEDRINELAVLIANAVFHGGKPHPADLEAYGTARVDRDRLWQTYVNADWDRLP